METKLIEDYNAYVIKWASELSKQEGIPLNSFLGDIREYTIQLI